MVFFQELLSLGSAFFLTAEKQREMKHRRVEKSRKKIFCFDVRRSCSETRRKFRGQHIQLKITRNVYEWNKKDFPLLPLDSNSIERKAKRRKAANFTSRELHAFLSIARRFALFFLMVEVSRSIYSLGEPFALTCISTFESNGSVSNRCSGYLLLKAKNKRKRQAEANL